MPTRVLLDHNSASATVPERWNVLRTAFYAVLDAEQALHAEDLAATPYVIRVTRAYTNGVFAYSPGAQDGYEAEAVANSAYSLNGDYGEEEIRGFNTTDSVVFTFWAASNNTSRGTKYTIIGATTVTVSIPGGAGADIDPVTAPAVAPNASGMIYIRAQKADTGGQFYGYMNLVDFTVTPAPGGGTVTHTIEPVKGYLTLAGESLALQQVVTVSPVKGALALAADPFAVSQSVTVSPIGSLVSLSADPFLLSQTVTIAPGKGVVLLVGDQLQVSSGTAIAPTGGVIALASDPMQVRQVVTVAPVGGRIDLAAGQLSLSQVVTIAPGKAVLLLVSDRFEMLGDSLSIDLSRVEAISLTPVYSARSLTLQVDAESLSPVYSIRRLLS